jgi:hypothetical protein
MNNKKGIRDMPRAEKSVIVLIPSPRNRKLEEFRRKYIHDQGRDVPFHITFIEDFIMPDKIDHKVKDKLAKICNTTKRFQFYAKPLMHFPTSKALCLLPVPVKPIEVLAGKIYKAFPRFRLAHGFPIYHMTIAYRFRDKELDKITAEFLKLFKREMPFKLIADRLVVYVKKQNLWEEFLSFKIG